MYFRYFQSVLSVAAKDNASEVELLRDGGFRFPRPAGSSVSTSVTEEVADMSVDELEEGEVVDTDDSVRSVEKKTEPNGTGAPRRRGYIPCDICGKLCRREKDLNEHNSRVHVPQVSIQPGRNRRELRRGWGLKILTFGEKNGFVSNSKKRNIELPTFPKPNRSKVARTAGHNAGHFTHQFDRN